MKGQFGKFLQEELQKEGSPSLKDFASMLGISYRTLFNIFDGKTEFTLKQALKASSILKKDIIGKYCKVSGQDYGILAEPDQPYLERNKSNDFTVSLNIKGQVDRMENMSEFLKKISNEAISLGLILL